MLGLALLCSGLLASAPDPTAAPAVDEDALGTYQKLQAKAGRDAEAHVKLALWCEAHGLGAERLKHLALAVVRDPGCVSARGLLGLVAYRDRWHRPEEVGRQIEQDEELTARLAEYNRRREGLGGKLMPGPQASAAARASAAAAHDALGLWCRKNGLEPEARAHFSAAIILDPYNDSPRKHLGYIKQNGRWMTREQIASAQREAESRRRGDRYWEPLLRKWKAWLADDEKREQALTLFQQVNDPYAVGAIVRVFRDGDPEHERTAVGLLAAIETPASTRELTALAVLSSSPLVRSAAIEALRRRPARDYAQFLVDQIQAPMRYQVEPVRGPGRPGALLIETPRFRMLRTYDAPAVFQPGTNFFGYVGYDPNGMPVIASGRELRRMGGEAPQMAAGDLTRIEQRTQEMIALANLKAASSQQQLLRDITAIERSNAEAGALNERISATLQDALDAPGLDPGDEVGWHRWWYDRLGYRYDPPAQAILAVSASPQASSPSIQSCFVAGTPVRTVHGLRPIESLQVGDQVLSQDTATGALTFQPIQFVHRNPPGATLRLELDNGEALVPSVYHRFWRAGKGWAIARDLKPGEALRTLEGRARIKAIQPGGTVPIFNLDVAETRTFFVGEHGALVHDNTLPPAAPAAVFDAEPALH